MKRSEDLQMQINVLAERIKILEVALENAQDKNDSHWCIVPPVNKSKLGDTFTCSCGKIWGLVERKWPDFDRTDEFIVKRFWKWLGQDGKIVEEFDPTPKNGEITI